MLALSGVTLLASARCEGLLMEQPGAVGGVVYRVDGSAEPTRLAADLVVDASGRAAAWTAGSATWVCPYQASAS